MKTIHPRKQSGSSLVIVISVLATLMVIVGVAAEYTWTVNRHVQRSNNRQTAIAVADSCIEVLFSNWRKTCSASATTLRTTNDFTAIPTPSPGQLNLPSVTNFVKRGVNIDPNNDEPSDYDPNYTISNYKLIAVTPEWTTLAAGGTLPMPMLGPTSGPPTPTTSLAYNYIASADVTLPALGKDGYVVAKVRRVFQKQQMSPWNFAIFYVDPLEIHPGPDFTVTGWVHTNSDLYTGHSSLTFADKVTYGSDWFVGFKPGETYHNGETPASPNYPSNLPPARDQAMQPFGLDATSLFNSTDPNPNNDSYRELIEQATSGYTDPLVDANGKSMRYFDQASLKILIDGAPTTPTVKIYRDDDTEVKFNSVDSDDRKLYNSIVAALGATAATTPSPTTKLPPAAAVNIQDNREAAQVRLTTLDIDAVTDAVNNGDINNNNKLRWNKIIYIADTSGSTNHRGIRLKNGKVLPSGGLTIASANPIYIQGDYNTGPGTPPSNATINNNPLLPTVPGYDLKDHPSSVVADAVSILSNSWVDTASGSTPTASATTVNTAIIAGIVPSSPVGGDGNYSGGAENFPRFLENWTNKPFTYYGSMVELYNSKQGVGKWSIDPSVYYAPLRRWYFDNTFKVSPPPGTIMIYSYIKGKWSVL